MENKRPIRLSWIAVLVVVAILCFGAYFIARRIVDARSPRLYDAISIPATANQPIEPLGSGSLYYDGSSLHAIDSSGRQIWSYPAGSLAEFSVGAGGVATWSGAALSLLNAQTGAALFSNTLAGNIITAKFGKDYAAVQIEQAGNETKVLSEAQREHNSIMLILDSGGRQVDEIKLSNQTVLDSGFFSNDQLFWTMSLNTEGTVPICIISSYKPGRLLAGRISDTEQVLYHAMFLSSKIRVTGETHVKDYDNFGNEIVKNRILVYGWCLVDVDETQDVPTMAFVPTGQADGTTGITDIRTIQEQTVKTIRLPNAAKQVFVSGSTVYAFSNDRVMVCRSGALEPDTFWLPRQIDKIVALTENHTAIATSGTSVFMIPLP